MRGRLLALSAGLCAALASVCAKLAMAESATLTLCEMSLQQVELLEGRLFSFDFLSIKPECHSVMLYVRVTFFGLIFLCNALMWTLFVKSMQLCSSTVEATITNTASNIFFTALLGHMLFGEALPLLWWAGASFIIAGMALIHKGDSNKNNKDKIS